MSVVRCDQCDRQIDSDFDAECFMGDTSTLCHVCREDDAREPDGDAYEERVIAERCK